MIRAAASTATIAFGDASSTARKRPESSARATCWSRFARAFDQRDLLRGREAAACAPRILRGLKGALARIIAPMSGAAPRESATQLGYQPALDGIRALAVLAVLLHHGRLGTQLVFRTMTPQTAGHPRQP